MRIAPLVLLVMLAACGAASATPAPIDGADPVLVIADGGGPGNGISVADGLGDADAGTPRLRVHDDEHGVATRRR